MTPNVKRKGRAAPGWLPAGAPAPSQTVLLLKPEDAAKALSISERFLWKLMDEAKIPCVRIGRAVRYDPRDLSEWISRIKNAQADPGALLETSPEQQHGRARRQRA